MEPPEGSNRVGNPPFPYEYSQAAFELPSKCSESRSWFASWPKENSSFGPPFWVSRGHGCYFYNQWRGLLFVIFFLDPLVFFLPRKCVCWDPLVMFFLVCVASFSPRVFFWDPLVISFLNSSLLFVSPCFFGILWFCMVLRRKSKSKPPSG